MVFQNISPSLQNQIIDVLSTVYWYKPDQQNLIKNLIPHPEIIQKIDWSLTKRQIAGIAISEITSNPTRYWNSILRIVHELYNFNDNELLKLKSLEDGESKYQRAALDLSVLRATVGQKPDLMLEIAKRPERKLAAIELEQRFANFRKELLILKKTYLNLITLADYNKRGSEFEVFLNNLFNLFDLNSHRPFRRIEDQIDGFFSIDGLKFLVEAKYTKDPIGPSEISYFDSKIEKSLDNTLGLFISENGFTEIASKNPSSKRSKLILMNGYDIVSVLEEKIKLDDMIRQKHEHASKTGEIFFIGNW